MILLGAVREELGRLEDAAWAHERAVRASVAMNGEHDPNTVRARANLGRAYAGLGRHSDAEPLLTQVIPVFESTKNTSELFLATNALGLVRTSQSRHADARDCFERALKLYEELYGPNSAEFAAILKNYATSAEAAGDRAGSAMAVRRAEEILRAQATTRH